MLFSLGTILNRLLPFATPGTPVVQDLVHLLVLCGLLYYAPQVQELYRQRARDAGPSTGAETVPEAENRPVELPNDDVIPPETRAPELVAQDDQADRVVPAEQADDVIEHEEQDPGEGPAAFPRDGAGDGLPITGRNRQVGAKKAKSLARRDQRRAYHEFMRSQGDAQRAQDEAGRAEREAAAAQEQTRRAAIEDELREKAKAEREEKRNREMQEREDERRRREMAVSMIRDAIEDRGYARLEEIASRLQRDVDWAASLIRASGLLTESLSEVTFITETNVVVRIRKEDLEQALSILEKRHNTRDANGEANGIVTHNEVARVLDGILMGG